MVEAWIDTKEYHLNMLLKLGVDLDLVIYPKQIHSDKLIKGLRFGISELRLGLSFTND